MIHFRTAAVSNSCLSRGLCLPLQAMMNLLRDLHKDSMPVFLVSNVASIAAAGIRWRVSQKHASKRRQVRRKATWLEGM